MDKPHVLFLIDVLASTAGGAEGVVLKMTRLLPKDRFRCSVATFSPEPELVPVKQFDCPVYLFPIRRTYDWGAFKAAIRLRRLIRAERFSIVHTFFPASDLLGGVVARLSGAPILISSRRDMGLLRSPAHWCAYRLLGGIFDQVHAVGEQVRAFHIEHDHLRPQKVVTVYNGVDVELMDRTVESQPPATKGWEGGPVVICVANPRPVKAIDVLVRTAAIVCAQTPAARFVVVGAVQDLRYFDEVMQLARQLKVSDKVIFLGQRNDIPRLLKASSVFYLPSRSEGLSNAMLEAMACATPCVATNVGGNAELLEDGVSGYLVPSENPAAAADRILKLLNDAGLRKAMGRKSRQTAAEKFSVDVMMRRLTQLYDEMLYTTCGAPAIIGCRTLSDDSAGDIG